MCSLITIFAFLLDLILGDPQKWPHPVRWIGFFIEKLELNFRKLIKLNNTKPLLSAGAILVIVIVSFTYLLVWGILKITAESSIILWSLFSIYFIYSSLCLKDLLVQSLNVDKALVDGDIDKARILLSMIVGRDTESLDENSIRKALVETMSENFSDGITAPLFYLLLGGPALAWAYKAINTLDSMIAYKNDKYLYFGRFAAKLDDLANYLPARISALLLVASAWILGYNYQNAFYIWQADKNKHSSPNSAHPEAAVAGALGLIMGGPAFYKNVLVEKPYININGRNTSHKDVLKTKKLLLLSSIILVISVSFLIFLFNNSIIIDWR